MHQTQVAERVKTSHSVTMGTEAMEAESVTTVVEKIGI